MRRGISLVELLVAIVIVSLVSLAAADAFVAGIRFQSGSEKVMDETTDRVRFEDKMSGLLARADLHGNGSYFISPVPASVVGNDQTNADNGTSEGSTSLVFTAPLAPRTPYLSDSQDSFESLNQRYGPSSDCTEFAFSMTAVGDAEDKTGLFFRWQAPAGTDPTQGGQENLLNPLVQDIRFEFYDGSNWASTWDSRSDNKGKLPAAVRVTYAVKDDPVKRSFIVRLPVSDVNLPASSSTANGSPSNPNQQGGPSSPTSTAPATSRGRP